jgi:hypothetical protein
MAIQTLNVLNLVLKIESLLASMYNYFVHSSKHHLEATKLVEILECKGNKIMKNIKTRWISMLSSSRRVLQKYKPLIVKIVEDYNYCTSKG